MPKVAEPKYHRLRGIISLIAGIIVGVILLTAGSGKIFAFGEMPGQTMQFIGAILPDAWLTPGVAYFFSEILLPYIIPWAELCMGLFLLLRIWPRFIAALALPLIASFMANNIWYISQGKELEPCPCWGIWAILLGNPTHLQSLYIDIGLFALALIAVLVHPAGFFASPPWLAKFRKRTVKVKK